MPEAKQTQAKMTETQVQDTRMHTHDVVYDLVSVVYHALQNAASCSIYATDAQLAGDLQLVHFFQERQQKKKMLLKKTRKGVRKL